MPSYFESLSMVALEAWALGRPVLANGRCDVLQGQCLRSNAGLFYENLAEFVETLGLLQSNRYLARRMGENGREYFQRHYAWPVIVRKYMETLDGLKTDDQAGRAPAALERLPGWLARRRATLPPSQGIVATLPTGPVPGTERHR
jgi:hypothetical protein